MHASEVMLNGTWVDSYFSHGEVLQLCTPFRSLFSLETNIAETLEGCITWSTEYLNTFAFYRISLLVSLLFLFMSKFVSRAGSHIDQLQEQLSRRETNEERGN